MSIEESQTDASSFPTLFLARFLPHILVVPTNNPSLVQSALSQFDSFPQHKTTNKQSLVFHTQAIAIMTSYPPMERVLYNLHLRMCTFALRSSSHISRGWAERTLLLLSVCCFGALYMSHRAFVYRPAAARHASSQAVLHSAAHNHKNIPLTCLPSIRGFTRNQAAITHILLLNYEDPIRTTTTTTSAAGESSSYAFTVQNNTVIYGALPEGGACQAPADSSSSRTTATSPALLYNNNNNHAPYNVCQDSPSDSLHPPQDQIYFSYSQVKGYLLLPPTLIQERHDLPVQYVMVSPTDSHCFGEPFLQELVFRILNPETVIVNWLLGLEDKQGYAYHAPTETLMDLHPTTDHERLVFFLQERIGSKLSVVLRTCFLFLITTTLVAFTLRETQERMLDFTQQLHHHVRHGQPVVHLVTRHLIDNLVFCPIMVGMIFFLIEFYHGDKALAFMVLSIVWLAEVFSVVSLRSTNGQHFFPRIFFLLFSLFHFYLFSFPFGFTHTALVCTACFMIHSMLFFWHRYELPAVAFGRVSPEQPRMMGRPLPPPEVVNLATVWNNNNNNNEIPPLRREPPLTAVENNSAMSRANHHGFSSLSRYAPNGHGPIHSNVPQSSMPNAMLLHPDTNPMGSGNSLSTLSAGGGGGGGAIHAHPRPLQRSHSHVSTSSHGGGGGNGGNNSHHSSSGHNNNMSRQTSASALYWGDEDGDDSSSFHYFMGGEVVVPRQTQQQQQQQRNLQQQQQQQQRPRIPDHVVALNDVTHTPIRDNLSAARHVMVMGPEHPRTRTAPALSPEWT